MTARVPRLLIGAARSGGGKTTVVCALLRALQRQGLRPAAFKCGPDFIDPLFHASVLGAPGGNLDLFFTPEQTVRALLAEGSRGCGVSVLEGVMGYYDGLGGTTDRASSWDLARATGTPAVLLLDAGGASLSVCAQLRGFLNFRPDSFIRAVLLNRCTAGQYAFLKPLLERECGVPVAGYLPPDPAIALESRHLGLVTAAEVPGLLQKLDRAADALARCADLPLLLRIAESAPGLSYEPLRPQPAALTRPVFAVARDEAFCFLYAENLALLRALGAEVRFFSPLRDRALPEGASALWLCGGYPELHAGALSENRAMLDCVRRAVSSGLPTLAECGGFLYLHRTLCTPDGEAFPMAGFFPGGARYTGRLRRFGYATLTAARANLLLGAGAGFPAHEFHYYESDDCGADCTARKPLSGASWPCVHAGPSLFAGFPHLYFYADPAAAARFVRAAAAYREDD